MKKIGILNAEISKIIAESAHTDMIMIGDAGMPVPKGVKFIDLAVSEGIPGFLDVLEKVLEELHIEGAVIDLELKEKNPQYREKILKLLGDAKVEEIPHEKLKEISKNCVAAIRTGEFTPYSNIILKSGVVF